MQVIKHNICDHQQVATWKWLLSNWDVAKIEDHYNMFKAMCYSVDRLPENIENLSQNLFSIGQSQIHFKHAMNLPLIDKKNHRLEFPYCFRIRIKTDNPKRIEDILTSEADGHITINSSDMKNYSDVWEKPVSLCHSFQRLNRPGKSVLYTSFEPSTAILETEIENGDFFFLIAYKRKSEINFSNIVHFVEYEELTAEENLKRYAIFNLLRNEFSRTLPQCHDTELQYAISHAIAKRFFIADNTQGIQYPSIKGLCANNFAFIEKSDQFLDFKCVRLCQLCRTAKRLENPVKVFFDGYWNGDQFVWYESGSEYAKQLLTNDAILNILFQK